MITANYQNIQQKRRMQDDYLAQLQTQVELNNLTKQAYIRGLPIRNNLGSLSVDEAMNLPRVPVKPKEAITEDDVVMELSQRLKPYMLNISEITKFIDELKSKGALFSFLDFFEPFEKEYLQGASRLTSAQILNLYSVYVARRLQIEQKVDIASVGPSAISSLAGLLQAPPAKAEPASVPASSPWSGPILESLPREPETILPSRLIGPPPAPSAPPVPAPPSRLTPLIPVKKEPITSTPTPAPSPTAPATAPTVSATVAKARADLQKKPILPAKLKRDPEKGGKYPLAKLKKIVEKDLELPNYMIDTDASGKSRERRNRDTFISAIIEFQSKGIRAPPSTPVAGPLPATVISGTPATPATPVPPLAADTQRSIDNLITMYNLYKSRGLTMLSDIKEDDLKEIGPDLDTVISSERINLTTPNKRKAQLAMTYKDKLPIVAKILRDMLDPRLLGGTGFLKHRLVGVSKKGSLIMRR